MPCAPGTVWNQQKLTCDHEWASPCVTGSYLTSEGLPCGGGSVETEVEDDEGKSENGSGDSGNGEGGENCQDEVSACKFWAANNDCYCKPTDGDCSWQTYVAKTCPKSCGTCNEGGNGGGDGGIDGCVIDCSLGKYLPHPTDCRKFIQCAPYGPEEMPCAPGTVWNQQKLTCDHEWASPCVTGSYLTPEGLPCGGGSGGNGSGDGGDEGNGGGDEGNRGGDEGNGGGDEGNGDETEWRRRKRRWRRW
nr:eggshell protein 2A-like [Penaeus vannamei]